jgi:hypothetical protein
MKACTFLELQRPGVHEAIVVQGDMFLFRGYLNNLHWILCVCVCVCLSVCQRAARNVRSQALFSWMFVLAFRWNQSIDGID